MDANACAAAISACSFDPAVAADVAAAAFLAAVLVPAVCASLGRLLPALFVLTSVFPLTVCASPRSWAFFAKVIPIFMAAHLLPITVDTAHNWPAVNTFVVCGALDPFFLLTGLGVDALARPPHLWPQGASLEARWLWISWLWLGSFFRLGMLRILWF